MIHLLLAPWILAVLSRHVSMVVAPPKIRDGPTFEHGRAPDASVRRRQGRLEPIFHTLFEGCHRTRNIPDLIRQGGFEIEELEWAYLAGFPKSATYCWGGPRSRADSCWRTDNGSVSDRSGGQSVSRIFARRSHTTWINLISRLG
jgi:hypothetical protein